MPTDKQKAASRANGARSRGPKTPEGKARSARNSLNHGLLARAILLEGESHATALTTSSAPSTNPPPRQRLRAPPHRQNGRRPLAPDPHLDPSERSHSSLAEHEMRLDRQFFRAVDRFVRLRTFFAETNPVVQPAQPPAPPAHLALNPPKPVCSR